jgi:hypothetical protein
LALAAHRLIERGSRRSGGDVVAVIHHGQQPLPSEAELIERDERQRDESKRQRLAQIEQAKKEARTRPLGLDDPRYA